MDIVKDDFYMINRGLRYESKTDLATRIAHDKTLMRRYQLSAHHFKKFDYQHHKINYIHSRYPVYDLTDCRNHHLVGIISKQIQFYNVMLEVYGLHKSTVKYWQPDECFFNFRSNTIYIVEKKWQQTTGSTDEKLFGFGNKRRLYQKDFNQLTIPQLKRLGLTQKPAVSFCALFNSQWWLHGISKMKLPNGKIKISKHNVKPYMDDFDSLRLDGIKIFFDRYNYHWFGL